MLKRARLGAAMAFAGVTVAGIPAALVTSAPWWALVLMPLGGAVGALAPELLRGREELDERRGRLRALDAARTRPSLADLLRPERVVVDFVGRSAEMAELTRWAEDPGAEPLYLVVGPGGVGKSRLAVEFAARMGSSGWSVHWVRDGLEATALPTVRGVQRKKPLLLVVDYAEIRGGLGELLHDLARTVEDGARPGLRVRVLLIARADGEWWQRLAAGEAGVRDVVRRAGVLRLQSELGTGLGPADLVAQAVPRFAAMLRTPVPADWRVQVPEDVRVLTLHAAALLVALHGSENQSGGATDVMRLAVDTGVFDTLIKHEARLWLNSLPEALAVAGERGARRIVAAAALFALHDERDAVAVLSRVPELADPWRAWLAAGWIREIYPAENPDLWSGAVAPDLVAERVVVRTLSESAGLATALFAAADPRQILEGLTVLARAAQHHEDAEPLIEEVLSADVAGTAVAAATVAVQTGGVIGRVLARVLLSADVEARDLERIAQTIPFPTLALRAAAEVVNARLVQALDGAGGADGAKRAERLHQWSKTLYQAGHAARAAVAQAEAVELLRGLEETEPGVHRAALASALNNLGVWYSVTGELGKAREAAESAVGIRREIARSQSVDADEAGTAVARAELAGALVNLAVRYSHIRRPDKSLAPAREAVAILTVLDEQEPKVHRAYLATAWGNLGEYLSENGAAQEAVAATARALAMRRILAAEDPDRFQPVLLTSLLNFGVQCSAVGRWTDAVTTTCEAVLLGLRFVEPGQATNVASLAMALADLADLVDGDAPHDVVAAGLALLPESLRSALALTEESVRHWHLLSEQELVVYRPRLLEALRARATRRAAAARQRTGQQETSENL